MTGRHFTFTRRGALAGGALLAGSVPTLARAAAMAIPDNPVVATSGGRLRGARNGDVAVFKGIPYGASTAGGARFLAPQPPVAWRGTRDALQFGASCPQLGAQVPHHDPVGTAQNEDCLVLNIWSPALGGSGQRKPVMVWLHGGGFATGSGSWAWYDGTNLARLGDVVVVTLNHRLNIFGHLYLGDIDPGLADSGNAGMLDIVLALRWVRDNIAAFGGDPGNVTLFGESGGSAKVGTLMAMPGAAGLFHKAICQSGPALRGIARERAAEVTQSILKAAELAPGDVDGLRRLPADRLLELMRTTLGPGRRTLAPVVAGPALPRSPFSPDAPAVSAHVPLIIGTNRDEAVSLLGLSGGGEPANDDAAVVQRLGRLGVDDKAEGLVAAYRATRPGASSQDILIAIASDLMMRMGSITLAERKVAQGEAPVFMYLFTWESPVHGMKSTHGIEVPLVFRNLDVDHSMTGSGPERVALADRMSRAWAAFAHSGQPAADDLPAWPAYDAQRRATLQFDTQCRIVDDPMREDRLALVAAGLAERSILG